MSKTDCKSFISYIDLNRQASIIKFGPTNDRRNPYIKRGDNFFNLITIYVEI